MRDTKPKQSLAAKLGTGEAVSSDFVAARLKIENELHKPNDDGTERLFYRRVGSKKLYRDKTGEPLSDHDDPNRLHEFGLPIRDIARLEENGCEEIADVRSAALSDTEIPGWQNCGLVTLQNIRDALKNSDKVDRKNERTT
jgi:hypothetical protein